MIRQYQEEIERLRRQLEDEVGEMNPVSGEIVQERVVKVQNPEKIAQMEEQIKKEKE